MRRNRKGFPGPHSPYRQTNAANSGDKFSIHILGDLNYHIPCGRIGDSATVNFGDDEPGRAAGVINLSSGPVYHHDPNAALSHDPNLLGNPSRCGRGREDFAAELNHHHGIAEGRDPPRGLFEARPGLG
jgi:hypothetical protein